MNYILNHIFRKCDPKYSITRMTQMYDQVSYKNGTGENLNI